MNPAYLSPLANHLWQSTLFAGMAGLLTLVLRNNRARVRHWVWLAASWKFLIPFSVLISLGGHVQWRGATETAPSSLSVVVDEVSQPFTVPAALPAPMLPAAHGSSPVKTVLLTIWACGFFGISCSWLIRWRRIHAVVHAGTPLRRDIPIRTVSSPATLEPGIFGVFRPVMVLPESIFDRLTAAQVNAVIAHELCHVYHRDNLIASIHMFVETLFWFHPLLWWIGKRMVEERERACDEEVLRLGCEPRVYAEGILNVCKSYMESPLVCVSGVTGANLKRRIEVIMSNRTVKGLHRAKKVLLVGAGVAALAGPLWIGIGHAPVVRAEVRVVDRQVGNRVVPTPGLTERTTTVPAAAIQKATAAAAKPQQSSVVPPSTEKALAFDAVSVKPNTTATMGGREVPGVGGGRLRFSPGRVLGTNVSTRRIILEAYHLTDFQFDTGGPGWLDSARFDIEGKAESAVNENQLRQMLQTMLSDRFKLVVLHEKKEMAVYALTVDKNGPKLIEWKQGEPMPKVPHPEGEIAGVMTTRGTLQQFADELSRNPAIGRPVLDKTGIQGSYLFQIAWGPDESIMTAVRGQLGLRFEPQKSAVDTLVVDRIEKPEEN